MTTSKFLTVDSSTGLTTLVQAPSSSAGAGTANQIIRSNDAGVLDPTFLPPGVDLQVITMPAFEALTAGDFVNIFSNSGTVSARKADASNNRPARGYVLANFASAATATVYLSGRNTGITGATIGGVFLSASTPGGFASTPPATPGANVILQSLGNAIGTTSIQFEYDAPIALTV